MIKIYALIDPRNSTPFYIGASFQPEIRFIEHISGFYKKPPKWYKPGRGVLIDKALFLYKMSLEGYSPELKILKESNVKNVNFWERFYYEYYKMQGCKLFNSENHFFYHKRHYQNKTP